ncbi:uncharacterized protein LOC109597482 [Aethina tumida]|uniref:uncharacterized protein LOC109597482 n=1 Tax=Aethina tumida TaxID=116153 RepID=UPI002148D524|nr:uncharacterized protein LOC109597482 [Aethina tumida]
MIVRFLLINVSVLILAVTMVSSLKCYHCHHVGEEVGCPSKEVKECTPGNDSNILNESPMCRTLTQYLYFLSGDKVVNVHECTYYHGDAVVCLKAKYSGSDAKDCYCDTDVCNTSPKTAFSVLWIIVALIIKLL